MSFIRRNFYLLSFAMLAATVTIILLFRPADPAVPPYLDRIGSLAQDAEWLNAKAAMDDLTSRAAKNPDDLHVKLLLVQAYIQEARITGNYGYYNEAAMKLLNDVLKKDPENFIGLSLQASVYLNQHHFKEAYETGIKLRNMNPHAALVYGILTDACVELGWYDEAVAMADTMCAIRPDLKSYSRISYLREIFGDYEGAKEAMKMALRAGVTGLEQTEWCRVHLGRLYELTGNIDTAELIYQAANTARANYAPALAGLARVEAAKKNYASAIKLFEQAQSLTKDKVYAEDLASLYRLNGDISKSNALVQESIKEILPAKNNKQKGSHGHYADKELAMLYLTLNDTSRALLHARLEYERRPDNIEVNDLMAWIQYKSGHVKQAAFYANKALKTGSKNPELLCRTGIIFFQAGEQQRGASLIYDAVSSNPFLPTQLLAEAKPFLEQSAQIVIH
jgi:tetratricopeptide (TPR) repeat protein